MGRIIILVTEPEYFTSESLAAMRKVGKVLARRMSKSQLKRAIGQANAVVVRVETKLDKDILRNAKHLQCVISATTGLNHIDTKFLSVLKIPLFSLHGTHSIPTAEHALTLIMASARNIVPAHEAMSRKEWNRWKYIGFGITGKTLGIFGIGRIGTELAARAAALKMRVVAYDPYVSRHEAAQRGAIKLTWTEFLKQSDFFSLHAPLTPETKGVFNAKAFHLMKPTAIIVNTARGPIIQERALLGALNKGRIRAAALDVYSEEPLPHDSHLVGYAKTHGNLILTPHIAASTREAMSEASSFAAEAVSTFFKSNNL